MNDTDAIGYMLKQVECRFNLFHPELISRIFATFQQYGLEAHFIRRQSVDSMPMCKSQSLW